MKKSAPFYHGGTLAWGEVKLLPPSPFPYMKGGEFLMVIKGGQKAGCMSWGQAAAAAEAGGHSSIKRAFYPSL